MSFQVLGGGGQGNTGHERVVKGRGGKRACRLYLRSATGYKYLSHTPEGLCPLETVWQEHSAPVEGKSVDTVLKPAQTTWLYKSLSENYTKLFTTPLSEKTSSRTLVASFPGYVHVRDHSQYTIHWGREAWKGHRVLCISRCGMRPFLALLQPTLLV